MTVPVVWFTRHPEILARGYADQGLLEAWLDRSVWTPPAPLDFEHHELGPDDDFPDVDGAIVIFNGRTHAHDHRWINDQLATLRWAVVMLCGDEEAVFPWQRLKHPNMSLFVMQPQPQHAHLGLLPGGWYPGTRQHLAQHDGLARPLGWFFAGQVTHERRIACVEGLGRIIHGRGEVYETDGYLQEAIDRRTYFDRMVHAKVVPSPSGPYSMDCARTFEALEAGCVPIADTASVYGPHFDYWTMLFGEGHGIPTTDDWSQTPELVSDALAGWPSNAVQTFSRWQQWKREKAHEIDVAVRSVSGYDRDLATVDDLVTVIVTTSPVPGHPATGDLDETLASVRRAFPRAEIIIAADGVRPEQQIDRAADYIEYLRRVCWAANFRHHNVVPLVLDQWVHQANTTRAALALVATPLVLFVEHDTPLVDQIGDMPVETDWDGIARLVLSGQANVVQLYENAEVHPEHEKVLLDREPWALSPDVPVRRTSAWWQRPHLASTRFYREQIMGVIPEASRTMIEDFIYPRMSGHIQTNGEPGWWDWRCVLYTPEGNTRRSGHLDSRGDDQKWPMS